MKYVPLAALLTTSVVEAINDPPNNPFLAESSWPVCHGNSYATDSSPFRGPVSKQKNKLAVELVTHDSFFSRTNTYLPVSIVADEKYMWATSVTSALLLENHIDEELGVSELKLLDTYDNGKFDFSYHGAYSFVSSDGHYFSSSQTGFGVYSAIEVGEENKEVKIIKRGEFSMVLNEPYEKVIGVLPLFSKNETHTMSPVHVNTFEEDFVKTEEDEDGNCYIKDPSIANGHIVVVSSSGKVAVVARVSTLVGEDFYLASPILQLPEKLIEFENYADKDEYDAAIGNAISNSFAVDEDGGIYFVSAKSVHFVQWVEKTFTNDQGETKANGGYLVHKWSKTYSRANQALFPGRLGKGSGSSPSIYAPPPVVPSAEGSEGLSEEDKLGKLLILTDGNSPMNLLAFKASDGILVGNASVLFGQSAKSRKHPAQSTSEQSVVVYDNKAIVVQNWIKEDSIPLFCKYFGKFLPGKAKNGCVHMLGVKPLSGVEQFEINPTSGQLTSSWTNKKVQCSSSIPAVSTSEDSRLFYCIGMRPRVRHHKAAVPHVVNATSDGEGGENNNSSEINETVDATAAAHKAGTAAAQAAENVVTVTHTYDHNHSEVHPDDVNATTQEIINVTKKKGSHHEAEEANHPLVDYLLSFVLPDHVYTLEAINLADGTLNFSKTLGSGVFFNPNYAAVQLGKSQDVYVGTMGGVLKVAPTMKQTKKGKRLHAVSNSIIDNYETLKFTDIFRHPTAVFWYLSMYLNLPATVALSLSFIGVLLVAFIVLVEVIISQVSSKHGNKGGVIDDGLTISRKNEQLAADDDLRPLPNSSSSSSLSASSTSTDLPVARTTATSSSSNSSTEAMKQVSKSDGNGGSNLQELREKLKEEQRVRVAAKVAARSSTVESPTPKKREAAEDTTASKRSRRSSM